MYKERTYRQWVKAEGLIAFEVKERETDLLILAKKDLSDKAHAVVLNYRRDLEGYMKRHPDFYSALEPVEAEAGAPEIIKAMADAGSKAGVGPMAAVAGAMAEFVGRELLNFSSEVVVENGGDIFLKKDSPAVIGIYAGNESPFTGKLAIEVGPSPGGIGVCTSSGTVSHSLSFGRADAALMISGSAALSDAAATAAGNMVKTPADIEKAIDAAKRIEGIEGILILIKDKVGSWGSIKLI